MTRRPAERGDAAAIPWQLNAVSFLTTGLLSVVGITAPGLQESFGVGYPSIAGLSVGQTVGGLLGAAAVGVVAVRALEPPRLALATGLALLVALASPSYGLLLGAIVASGFAGMALATRAQADLSRVAGERRGHALSVFHVWGGAGSVFLPLALSGMLLVGLPWQSALALLAATYVLYLLSLRGLPSAGPTIAGRGLGGVDARARWAVAIAVLGTGLQLTIPLWLPTLMHDGFGASQALASASVSVYAMALLAARVAGTRLLARVGETAELWACVVVCLVGYGLLALAAHPAVVVAAAALVGAGVGPLLPLGMARTVRATGDDRLASSLVMTLAAAAQIALPALVVALNVALELQTALTCTVAAAVVIAVAVRRSDPRRAGLPAPDAAAAPPLA